MMRSSPAHGRPAGPGPSRLVVSLLAVLLSVNAHAIVDGTVDIDNTYSSVGYYFGADAAGNATLGSVVALDALWVLTAAHVVEGTTGFLVMGDFNTAGGEGVYLPAEVIIHEDYVPGESHDDLALLRVSAFDPIDPALVDVSFATLSGIAVDDALPDMATLAGYGLTEPDGAFDENAPISRRYTDAATDPLGFGAPGSPEDCSSAALLCTFDTSGGAPGDSGGAMWLDYGGDPFVAAVMSYIFDDNDDWDDGYWTAGMSTAYYRDWISLHAPTAMFGVIPLPPALYLFGAGLLALGGAGRRRRQARR